MEPLSVCLVRTPPISSQTSCPKYACCSSFSLSAAPITADGDDMDTLPDSSAPAAASSSAQDADDEARFAEDAPDSGRETGSEDEDMPDTRRTSGGSTELTEDFNDIVYPSGTFPTASCCQTSRS